MPHGPAIPQHSQIIAGKQLHIMRVLADYYHLMQPHEQDLYRQIGASFKATGTFPFASAGDWGRKMIEKYASKSCEVTPR